MKLVMPVPPVIKYCRPLFPVQLTLPSPTSMPGPDTTFRTMAPCCLHSRPQITGFFIQSPCKRGNIIQQLQQRIPRHTLRKCIGTINEKNCPPAKIFLLFLSGSLFLSENFASCYRMLWVGHSHFSPAPCQNIQEIKPTSIPCLQKRETCTNSYHKLGSQPHYKSRIPPACILSNHESFLH